MPTNPTEWRERLVAVSGYYNAEIEHYLAALLREWDAHEPEPIPRVRGAYQCMACDGLVVEVPQEPGRDLCPAHRRMMGGEGGTE